MSAPSPRPLLACVLGRFASLGCWVALVAAPALSAPTTLIDNGPSDNRVDIVFLGDGYTGANHIAGVYDDHINDFVDYLLGNVYSDPLPRYTNFFNVHKIVTNSNQSGASAPEDPAYPDSVDTYFDATYVSPSSGGSDRLILIDQGQATNVINSELLGTGITADMQFMTVNSTKYGGSGGTTAVFAGANGSAAEVGVHEIAHSFSGLADEYGGYTTPYTGPEPSEPNVTTDPAGGKWSRWDGFDDPRASYLDVTTVDGGRYYNSGIYRPTSDSKMRSLGAYFNAVSREELILSIYEHVEPIDSYRRVARDGEDLWVDVVDPDVIDVAWYVDEQLVVGATGDTFNPADWGYDPGEYLVHARAYDNALDHSYQGGLLDLVRKNQSGLEQIVKWEDYVVRLPGDYDENGVVDENDYAFWRDKYGGSSPAWFGNRDGVVDAADYTIWLDNFGKKFESSRAVPEPATWALAAVALAAVSRRRSLFTVEYAEVENGRSGCA